MENEVFVLFVSLNQFVNRIRTTQYDWSGHPFYNYYPNVTKKKKQNKQMSDRRT